MTDPSSRYGSLPTYSRDLTGAPAQLLREPRLPAAPEVAGRIAVRVGERLDQVAARHLDDPYSWWRFADAQPGVDVDELDRPGRWLLVPRRGG